MCIGGGGGNNNPPPAPPPPPPPVPAPTPTEVSPVEEKSRQDRAIQRLRAGFASTIKSGPQGAAGKGPELATQTPTGLAAMFPSASGRKKTLG